MATPYSSTGNRKPDQNADAVLASLRHVMLAEAEAIKDAIGQLGNQACQATNLILNCDGKIITTGVGKTGCVARKAAATFSSTGTPSIFLHAAEASHGDLGVVSQCDTVLAISNSGQSNEILNLIPYLQRYEIPLICITGNRDSHLAKHSQIIIGIDGTNEADELGLAPTSSSTVAMAICDAIAITVAKQRGLTADQFAVFHPGGMLGRKLLITTQSIMSTGEDIPVAQPDMKLRDAIGVISHKKLGALTVIDGSRIVGVLTDGDIRRVLQKQDNPLSHPIKSMMTNKPVVLRSDTLAAEALRLMQNHAITVLPVVDENEKLVGILHLHDLIKAGLV